MTEVSVGDIVLYNHGVHETVMVSDQPLAALVCYVHAAIKDAPPKINLAVFGKNGDQWQKHSVTLWDGYGDAPKSHLAFAYPVGTARMSDGELYAAKAPAPSSSEGISWPDTYSGNPEPAANDGVPADPNSDVLHPSTRGPNMLARDPNLNGDAPTGFELGGVAGPAGSLVNPPIGPEYKPDAEHPMPNAPEPVNKVPAVSPANPDRPLD